MSAEVSWFGLAAVVLGAAFLLLVFRRGRRRIQQHLQSRLATVRAGEDGRFELRHRVTEPGTYVAYARYKIENRGTEDDLGIRCRFEARVDGGEPLVRDLGVIGSISNPPPLEFEEKARTTYDTTMKTGGMGYRHTGRIELAEIEQVDDGADLALTGVVTPNELTRIDEIEVYIVPAARRL